MSMLVVGCAPNVATRQGDWSVTSGATGGHWGIDIDIGGRRPIDIDIGGRTSTLGVDADVRVASCNGYTGYRGESRKGTPLDIGGAARQWLHRLHRGYTQSAATVTGVSFMVTPVTPDSTTLIEKIFFFYKSGFRCNRCNHKGNPQLHPATIRCNHGVTGVTKS